MTLTDFEQMRRSRMAQNQSRLQELGLEAAALAIRPAPPAPPVVRTKKAHHVIQVCEPVRRSGRVAGRAPETYAEDAMFASMGLDRLDLISAPRRSVRVTVNPDQIAALRARQLLSSGGTAGDVFVVDSGRGVRVQGGRVYDSQFGVTCHWCRQKTLENHVVCTSEGCGGGRKLPVAFCGMCLLNRHGEDLERAIASASWVCPSCRGGCGPGCTDCCNCGPCRKAAGQTPTRQLIGQARQEGFDNVHDYLIHRQTGESPQIIAARKECHGWGAWLVAPGATRSEPADGAVALAAHVPQLDAIDEPHLLETTCEQRPTRRTASRAKTLASMFTATKVRDAGQARLVDEHGGRILFQCLLLHDRHIIIPLPVATHQANKQSLSKIQKPTQTRRSAGTALENEECHVGGLSRAQRLKRRQGLALAR